MDWKKEIKLGDLVGRKSPAGAGVAEPVEKQPAQEQSAKERTSLWKRELRVGKPKDEPTTATERLGLSRFAATPSADEKPKPAQANVPEAPAEERRSRFSRFARPGDAAAAADGAPVERKPSRFARPGKPEQSPASKDKAPGLLARLGSVSLTRPKAADGEAATAKEKKPKAAQKPKTARRSLDFSFRRTPAKAPGAAKDDSAGRRAGKKATVVGLKVGASHIAAAQVASNGGYELLQFAREPLPKGIVVAGEVRDPDALAVELKKFFSKHKLPQRGVRLGVGTNRVGVRRFEISGLSDPSHLENAIRFRAQEVLPIPLEEAVLDYQVVGETTDEHGKKVYRVLLVVAYRDLVQRYVVACRAAGVKLLGVDLEAFALLRSLGRTAERTVKDAAVVVVSIGHDRSTFVVADGSTCEFARVLDWGGGALDVAVARTLDLTPSQAEPIKQSLTLNATQERLEGYTDAQATAVYEAVRKDLQSFVRELVSSLHFYQNQPGSLGIGEITITGGTAQLPGLAAELQRLIGVTVRVGDPFSGVKTGVRLDSHSEMGSLAVAIGLGMEV
jgi:type IV pilus assembly protein PilM